MGARFGNDTYGMRRHSPLFIRNDKDGEGLQKIAGDKLRRILETLTSSRLSGVAVGLIVTAIIQSSGATSVMCVSS